MSLEQCNIAIQTVLPEDQIPTGIALLLFIRTIAGTLAGPIGQAVFQKRLAHRLGQSVASQVYSEGGATDVRSKLEMTYGSGTPAFRTALAGFNDAVTSIFLVALILAALSAPFALLFEWKSVKKEKRAAEDQKENKVQSEVEGQEKGDEHVNETVLVPYT